MGLHADRPPGRRLLEGKQVPAAVPFPHLVSRPALSDADYRALADAFPSLQKLAGPPPYPNNIPVRIGAVTMLEAPSFPAIWREFVAHHVSGDFWAATARVFGDSIRALHPDLEARIGRPVDQWRTGRRKSHHGVDVLLDCQLVINTPVTQVTTVLGPHIDAPNKIVSGLYYFRPDDDPTLGGDLDLYRWRAPPRFHKQFAPHDAIERVATVPYAPNTHLAFVNSPLSVHGVSDRAVTDRPRFYVNFVAEMPFAIFEMPRATGWRPSAGDREAPRVKAPGDP